MQPFLQNVAGRINTRFEGKLHRVAVIFPNRRQAVFFRNHLRKVIKAPAFLPELLTIEELVQRSSHYQVADHFVQSFALYEAYAETMMLRGIKSYLDYEKFYPIGDILIRDFQELDAYMCNISQVFQYLRDLEGIDKSFESLTETQQGFLKGFWSAFSEEKMSLQQQKFLEMWEMLPAVYSLFHKKLLSKNTTTLGMLYRNLGNGRADRKGFEKSWDHLAFVGFNAFNKSEEALLQQWQESGLSSLWMDADEHYVANQQHEAGHFIRRNLYRCELKNEMPLLNSFAGSAKQVQVISVEGATAQAKVLPGWLANLPIDSTESVAIVLADEGLLIPVLQSLPAQLEKINVTMGYAFQQSVLFSFINLFFHIQSDLEAHRDIDIGYEFIQSFLQHPLCDWPDEAKQKLQRKMIQEVMLRIPLYQLQGFSDTGNYIFSPLHKPNGIFGRLCNILEAIQRNEKLTSDPLLAGLLVQAWQVIRQLESLFGHAAAQAVFQVPAGKSIAGSAGGFSLYFLAQSLRKQLASISVPFEGEPLTGIQVMGLLESRGLDFDHIIVLSANEGTLPRIQSPSSFLPYNIRRSFGLSIPEQQDSIFAYAFYRLLHRFSTMTLVYNSVVNDQSTGEISRFVQQLEFETIFKITRTALQFVLQSHGPDEITIHKSAEVMKQMNPYFLSENPKAFSPSAINSYIHCQLQFYFRYIARLEEPDEIQDEVDARVFGNIIHNLMESLYRFAISKNGNGLITKEVINDLKAQIPVLLPRAFIDGWREKSKQAPVFTGRLLVVAEVVKQYAEAYLSYDERNVPFEIEALETSFKEAFFITVNGRQRPVYFSGYIDRVDIVNGVYRMVDYKTGGDELEFSTIEKLFDRSEKKRNKAALQTLIYAWSFSKKFPDKKHFEPALLPLRVMQQQGDSFNHRIVSKASRGQKLEISSDNIHSSLSELEIHLRNTLEELMNAEVPFAQVKDVEKCSYCPYNGICGRQ